MALRDYTQNNWSGGLADSDLFGVKGSVALGVGLDVHSEPGILNVSQALKKDSGIIVDSFPQFAVNCSNGSSYWFGDSATIKKRTAAGTWSSISTALAGGGAVLGAAEWMGFIYFATAVKLHKMDVSSDAVTLNIQTLDTATWHPMVTQGLYLVIGNATKVATIDDTGTFTASGTPDITSMNVLPSYLNISCIEKFQTDVIIGTIANSNTPYATLFRWDLSSPTWIDFKNIPETGVSALIPVDNYLVVQAGNQGQFYYYDGSVIEKYRKVKGAYANSTMQVLPGSVCVFRGIAMVGVSNKSGNPCLEGIYSIGQHDNTYPLATMLEYVPSPNLTSMLLVGGLLSIGTTLLAGWEVTSTITISIADPAVVTLAGYGQATGTPVVFSTDGALPTGITAGTIYYIRAVNSSTFHLYDTYAHATDLLNTTGRVVTSGTQSGIQTLKIFGVDVIDWTNKYTGAYFKSLAITGDESRSKTFMEYVLTYKSLPTSTALTFAYDKNYSGTDTSLTLLPETNYNKYFVKSNFEANSSQFKVSFTVSGNTAPALRSLYVKWNEKEIL